MSLYQVQKLFFNVHNDLDLRGRYKEDPRSILKDYDLSDTETSALLGRDMGYLYRLGVHPWLLFQFSHIVGVSRDDYLRQIRGG